MCVALALEFAREPYEATSPLEVLVESKDFFEFFV